MIKTLLLFTLISYKKIISPQLQIVFGNACRFSPTCSEYALISVKKHGILVGLSLSLKRIIKCHPFSNTNI